MNFYKAVSIITTSGLLLISNSIYADTKEDMMLIELLMERNGYTSNGFERYDLLKDDEYRTYTMYTTKGESYAVMAVCDSDCNDLDLTVFNSSGDTIDTDYEADSNPIVSFVARHSQYKIRVELENCNSSVGCYVRVSGFREE